MCNCGAFTLVKVSTQNNSACTFVAIGSVPSSEREMGEEQMKWMMGILRYQRRMCLQAVACVSCCLCTTPQPRLLLRWVYGNLHAHSHLNPPGPDNTHTHTPSCFPQRKVNLASCLVKTWLKNSPLGTRWLWGSIKRRRKLILLTWRHKWITW